MKIENARDDASGTVRNSASGRQRLVLVRLHKCDGCHAHGSAWACNAAWCPRHAHAEPLCLARIFCRMFCARGIGRSL